MRKLTVTQARQKLLSLVDDLNRNPDEIVQMTRHGEPVAVLLSADRLDALLETIEILGDANTMQRLERGREQARARKTVPWPSVKKDLGLE